MFSQLTVYRNEGLFNLICFVQNITVIPDTYGLYGAN